MVAMQRYLPTDKQDRVKHLPWVAIYRQRKQIIHMEFMLKQHVIFFNV